ncbi:MAG: copper homeostasis protein CutC [Terracidiphilus sp.]|jgi:copper homeostasis protein
MKLEICVDSVESAIAAERGGAHRVELCTDLVEGGITPSAGLIASVRKSIAIGIYVMIRPRGGDFCYTDVEFEVMQEEIRQARNLGVDGIVLGLLDEQGRVDVARTRQLVELAGPIETTFHRAIDMTPDPLAALNDVVATGASRILTSGGAPSAKLGMREIARMVKAAKGRIAIMAASGVTADTIAAIAEATGASEFHSSARTEFNSPAVYRKKGMAMGDIRDREYKRFVVREESVRALSDALERLVAERAFAHRG